jgi:hypothetical protein
MSGCRPLRAAGCSERWLRGQLSQRFPAVESTQAYSGPSPFARRVEVGLWFVTQRSQDTRSWRGGSRVTSGARQVRRELASAQSRMLTRGPAGRCGFAFGRAERQLRKPCCSQVVALIRHGKRNAPKQRVPCEERSFSRCAHVL